MIFVLLLLVGNLYCRSVSIFNAAH